MSAKTLWVLADCSRAGTVGNQRANVSAFGTGSNDFVIFVGDNAYDNGANADYTSHFDDAYGAPAAAAGFKDLTPRAIAVPGNHEYHTPDAGGFRTYWSGRGQMPALPRGGFAHQRGNSRLPLTLNGWTLIFLDTAGDSGGAYFVDAQANVWTTGYLADLDSWLAAATGKAVLIFGHHGRYVPVASSGHGSQGGVQTPWAHMFNADGTCKIAAWFNGHDHMISATKLLAANGAVSSDETRSARFFTTGAGAGSFDVPGAQAWKDYGASSLYGYMRVTIPDMVGGEPQPAIVDVFTTGGDGKGTKANPKTYSLSPTGATTPPPGTGPTVTTNAASSVTGTGATLNGTVNPQGKATTYHFEYGTTTGYGSVTPDASAGSGSADVAENAAIAGLTAGVTYHYRIVAVNADGTNRGADRTFTTTGTPPVTSDVLLDDAFARTVASGLGTADSGQTWTATPASEWEVLNGEGVAHLLAGGVVHDALPNGLPQTADSEWIMLYRWGSRPSGAGSNVTTYLNFRYKDPANTYRLRLVGRATDDNLMMTLQRVKAGVATDLTPQINASGGATITVNSAQSFKSRIRITGGDTPRIRARTWRADAAEPSAWDIDVTDADPLTGTGIFRVRASIATTPTSIAIGFRMADTTITSLDVAPPTPPPNTPVIADCPSSGHVSSSPVSLNFASTPAPASYEASTDNGATWSTATSPASITIAVNQTIQWKVRAVGADGQRSTPAGCTFTRDPGPGGTNTPTYTPVTADIGSRIRSKITPINAAGPGSVVTSPFSPPVAAAEGVPTNSVAPTISGGTAIGDTLTLDEGTWTGSPSFLYAWYRSGVPIGGATQKSYTTTPADAGATITGAVRGVNSAGPSGWVTSSNDIIISTDAVAPFVITPPTLTVPPPDANVGEQATVDLGEWGGTPPIRFTFQWLRGPSATGPWTAIPGANGQRYTIQQADLGLWLDCDITPHNSAQP